MKKAEQYFALDNLADPENMEIQHHINIALKAHSLMHREKDYIDAGSLPGRYLSGSAAEKLAEITLEYINLRNGGD